MEPVFSIDSDTFSVLVFTAFLLNLITPLGLKAAILLHSRPDDSGPGNVFLE